MNILYYIIIFLIAITVILVVYIIKKFNDKERKFYELNVEKLEEDRKKISFLKSLEYSKKELEEFDVIGNPFSELYLARKDLFRTDLVKVSLHNLNPETIKRLLLREYTSEIARKRREDYLI